MVAIKEVDKTTSLHPPLQIIREDFVPQISIFPEIHSQPLEAPLQVELSTDDSLNHLVNRLETSPIDWDTLNAILRKRYLTGAKNLLNHDFADFRGNIMEDHIRSVIKKTALTELSGRIKLHPIKDLAKKNKILPGTTFISKKNGSVVSIDEETHNTVHEIDHVIGIQKQNNQNSQDSQNSSAAKPELRLVVLECKGMEHHRKRVYNGTTSIEATLQDAICTTYINNKFELLLAYAQAVPEITSLSYVVVTFSDLLDDKKTTQKRFRDEYGGILVGISSASANFNENARRIFDSIRADTKTFRKIGGYKNMNGPEIKHPHNPNTSSFRKLYVSNM